MIPRISIERWGGPSDDDRRWFEGRSLAVEWRGVLVEFNIGRSVRHG